MIGQISTFLIVSLTIIVVPGPDLVLIFKNAFLGGKFGAIYTVVGVMLGNAILASAAAVGLTALLLTSEKLFAIVRICGALYLVYLGMKSIKTFFSLRTKNDGDALKILAKDISVEFRRRALRQGLVSNLLNPKVAAFYLSLFPQFDLAPLSLGVQHILLALAFWCLASIWYIFVIVFLAKFERIFSSQNFRRRSEAVAGTILLGLGLYVLTGRSRA